MFNRWRRQGLVIIFRPLASGFCVLENRARRPLFYYGGTKLRITYGLHSNL